MAAVSAARVEDHDKQLARLNPAVFGVEGCPETGLVKRVEKVETDQDDIKTWITEQKATNKWLIFLLTILVTAVIGAAVKLLFGG